LRRKDDDELSGVDRGRAAAIQRDQRCARHKSSRERPGDDGGESIQDDIAFATVLQSDGKIIVVGTSFTTPARIVVTRYNANGAPDLTFGSSGITVTPLLSADASAFAATLQADGKLLVAGRSCPLSGGSSFLLLRYHTNSITVTGTPGTLDTGFGTGGRGL